MAEAEKIAGGDAGATGRKEYDFGVRTLAEQLYIYRGRTYEEVARETGVSVQQLKVWGGPGAGEWRKKRDEYLTSKGLQVTRLIGLRDKVLEQAEGEVVPNTLPQLMAGYRQLDAMIEAKLNPAGPGGMDKAAVALEVLREEAVYFRTNDPEALASLNRNFDGLVAYLKERLAA